MAQPDDTRRTTTTEALNIPRPQNSPGSKSSSTQTSPHGQHWQGASSSRSWNSSPKPRKSHDHDDHGNHHNKKSVFTKVKEKARKLKKSLSVRRRREENDLHTPYSTPPRRSGPVDDDENDHSEYFGSPLYEPTVDKQSTKEQPEETSKGSSEKHDMSKNGPPSLCSTDAKLSDLTISTRENTETANPGAKKPESSLEEKENTRSSPQTQSVKEYLMHKFEPGDDERALSQKITQTISPRYERMKDTMHSFLRSEEPSESTSNTSNVELDITPSNSSMESSSLSNHPNLSNTLESNPSNASNISQCSASTSATCQNQNLGCSSPVSSNLKPDSGLNSNPSGNATRDPASTSSHEDRGPWLKTN